MKNILGVSLTFMVCAMSNSRRDFLKVVGGGAAALGLGGTSLPACTTTSDDSIPSPDQVLEVSH
jgi:hypothetical protein